MPGAAGKGLYRPQSRLASKIGVLSVPGLPPVFPISTSSSAISSAGRTVPGSVPSCTRLPSSCFLFGLLDCFTVSSFFDILAFSVLRLPPN